MRWQPSGFLRLSRESMAILQKAQKEQIEQFAKQHNYKITKFFTFLESASKEQQPIQEAIDYCVKPKMASRFSLSNQLIGLLAVAPTSMKILSVNWKSNVQLIDIYGSLVGSKSIRLNIWVSSLIGVCTLPPKDRDVGGRTSQGWNARHYEQNDWAEIRYARMGYWVRKAPWAMWLKNWNTQRQTRNSQTSSGRVYLVSKDVWIEMPRNVTDYQIVDEINKLGFKTRKLYQRDRHDQTKIIKVRGGNKLNVKTFRSYIQKSHLCWC